MFVGSVEITKRGEVSTEATPGRPFFGPLTCRGQGLLGLYFKARRGPLPPNRE